MATKTKKTPKPQTAKDIAFMLAEVRERIAADTKLNDTLTKAFKAALEKEGIFKAGNYKLKSDPVFKVGVEELALPFAIEHNAVKIDTGKIREIFRLDNVLRFNNPEKYGFIEDTIKKVIPIRQAEE